MFSSLLRLHQIKLISLRHAQAEMHLLGKRHGGRIAEALELENGHGSLVGAKGFEPSTSCSQSRRAAGLRHAPNLEAVNKWDRHPYHACNRRAKRHRDGSQSHLFTASQPRVPNSQSIVPYASQPQASARGYYSFLDNVLPSPQSLAPNS